MKDVSLLNRIEMERKEFIQQCGKICLGGILMGGLLESCAGNYYATTTLVNNQITIKKSEFFEVKNGISKPRKYVLVKNEKLNFPISVYKINEDTYSALYMECTHNSCELNPQGDFLICPCHGSEFNNLGKVQNPPAETDLKKYNVTSDHENIYIHLS